MHGFEALSHEEKAKETQFVAQMTPFVKRKWLAQLSAETKLIYGIGTCPFVHHPPCPSLSRSTTLTTFILGAPEDYVALLKLHERKAQEKKDANAYGVKRHKKPEERIKILTGM